MKVLRVFGFILAGVAVLVLASGVWLYTPDKPRAELEAKYAAPPSQFINVLGDRLHVRDTGPRNAPAVILLHGFGSSLHTWDDWVPALEAKFRVIRYDQPGFGLTGADPSGDYSDLRSAAVLAGLMDQLGIQRADIVGHSMGGRIAWFFAANHPDRVSKLVLIAPDGFASPGFEYGKAPKISPLLRTLPYVLPQFMLKASLAPGYGNPAAMTEPILARYRDMMLAPGVRSAILARMEQNVLVDPEPLLRRIAAPTLLMWGSLDAMVPQTNAADYLRDIKGSKLEQFPGLGHLLMEENASTTVVPLMAFLAQP